MSSPSQNEEELASLIAQFQSSGLRELHARCGDFEIYLSADADAPGLDGRPAVKISTAAARPAATPVAQDKAPPPPTAPVEPGGTGSDWPAEAVVVLAPYLGTFYRSPKPGSPAYVELGSSVTTESELCLVEVMKLFTAVRSPIAGTVHAILAKDGQMVEAEQPIFVLIPA
jgi:acetyl-CoA carboxylase biotin carboxyl carrier protein